MSNNLQLKAKEENENLLEPLTRVKIKNIKYKQSKNSYNYISDVLPYILKQDIEEIIKNLNYTNEQSSELFEEKIYRLGQILGFTSRRPEKEYQEERLDNLWLSREYNYVIQCKNREMSDKIPKQNISQLLHSLQWYKNRYDNTDVFGVLFHKSFKLKNDATSSENIVVVDEKKLNLLKENLLNFSDEVIERKILNNLTDVEMEMLLEKFHFTSKLFKKKYTKSLEY